MNLRTHLRILVCSTLLPILILSAIIIVIFWREQRSAIHQRYLERVRALSLAIDVELDGHIRALSTLADSPALKRDDLRAFHEEANRVRAAQGRWNNIVLIDTEDGRQLLNLRRPGGVNTSDGANDRPALRNAMAAGKPLIPLLRRSRTNGEWVTSVIVPAKSGSGKLYALVAVIRQGNWLEFLKSYPVAPDATITLLDQSGIIIARTLNNDRWVGKPPALTLLERSRRAPEDAYMSTGLEGQWFYSAHSRSKASGWTVASGVPAESVEATLRASIMTLVAGGLGTAALAFFLAYILGRRIVFAFKSLTRSAGALVSGAPLPNESMFAVFEAAEVARAFQQAAAQLKASEAALRESEMRFRTMADTAPVLIWTSGLDRRFDYFNRFWLDFTGQSSDEALANGWTKAVHPDDLASCLDAYNTAFDQRIAFEMEYRLRHHDGSYRWVWDRGTPRSTPAGEFAGYIGSCLDITERKQARLQLQTVTDTMSAAVARCDIHHRYVWVSRGYAELFKRSSAEFAGRPIGELLGPAAYQSILPYIEKVLTGERTEYEAELNYRGIGRRWIKAVYAPTFGDDHQPDGWVAVINDITHSKALEAALRDSEQQLRQKADDLEKQLIASGRLVSLGEITASMAHEFNNPLGIVMGFTEELLNGKAPADPDSEPLKIIHAEAQRCAKIVKDLLDFSRPRSAEFSRVVIAPLIDKTLTLVGARLYKSKITADANIAADLPAVRADPVQIEQVLINLYLNAIDAMPGGGTLSIAAIGAGTGNNGAPPEVVITVADTGIGMDERTLSLIFQPFFSAHKKSGLGLGLAISERIVKNHGGKITVESKVGRGTKFAIHLPAIAAH